MTEFQGQWIDHKGNNIRPHVSVVMNFTKPTEEKPALLTLGEVETFLHEFGHSLHGMFANTRFESLSPSPVKGECVVLLRVKYVTYFCHSYYTLICNLPTKILIFHQSTIIL